METSERLEFCKICTHRKFDMHQGLLCGLTNARADFKEECPHLTIDEKEKTKIETEKKELLESEDYQIGGWLAIFLWIGIGLSAILSVISLIANLRMIFTQKFITSYSPCILGSYVAFTLCALYIAIATIIAFYRRKNYAVPLAYLWVIMNGLISLFGFLMYAEFSKFSQASEVTRLLIESIRGIVWVLIWGSFIACSERIKNIIPKPYCWRKVDLSILGVYTIALLLAFIGNLDIVNHPYSSKFISTNCIIHSMNDTRPTSTSNDITELPIYKEGNVLVDPIRMENTVADNLLEHQKLGLQLYYKHDILSNIEETPYPFFLSRGIILQMRATDMHNAELFSINITPEDYKSAIEMGDNYRVPQKDIQDLTNAFVKVLPSPFSDCQIIDIKNEQGELRYIIEIPDVTYAEMTQEIGYTYLRNFIYDNWDSMQDVLVLLNKMNHNDITYAFKGIDSDTTLDVTIKYPYIEQN